MIFSKIYSIIIIGETMKSIFIYNPKSGNSKIKKNLDIVVGSLKEIYETVDVHESKSAEDIVNVVIEASNKYDRIIFAGGDGTFNNVVSGLASCVKRPPLGYIPVGTCCDIAKNLGIPKKIKKALKIIKGDHIVHHDVGMINDKYFVYVVGIGACTGTSYTTKQKSKKLFGRIAYIKDGIGEFFKTPLSHVKLSCNGNTIEETVPLVLIMNTYSVGGIKFNRKCTLNDGLFDIVLVHNGVGKGRFNIIKFFLAGILGLRKKHSAVTMSAKEIHVEVEESLTWCVDGEEGPKGNVHIKNLHNHIQIITRDGE